MKYLFFILSIFLVLASCSRKVSQNTNVKDFGAIGDGRSDDTKALQKAINSCNKNLVLEKGRYKISSSLKLKSNMKIEGNGAKIILSEKSKFFALDIDSKNDIVLKDFTIVGQKKIAGNPKNTSYGSFLIRARTSQDIELDNITLRDHAFTGAHFSDIVNLKVKDCHFENIGYKSPTNAAPNPSYDYDGIFLGGYTHSSNIEISNCSFINMGPGDGDGIHTQTKNVNSLHNVTIRDCLFDGCTARAIKVQSGTDLYIKHNTFKNSLVGVGISMANDVSGVDILNNDFDNCGLVWGTNGIWEVNADKINFSYNTVNNASHVYRTNGKSTMSNFTISNNKVDSIQTFFIDGVLINGKIFNNKIYNFALAEDKSLYMAMLIAGNSKNVSISNNVISTNSRTHCAIYVQKTAKNIEISENDISLPEVGHKDAYSIHFSGRKNKEILKKNKVKLTKLKVKN